MWKPIEGYENYYEVNENGEVKSVDRFITNVLGIRRLLKGRVMKQSLSAAGYPVVNLHKEHVSRVALVHVLVAKAFVPNPHGLPTVNHIDGNKKNNVVSNLEWASYADNNIHALRHALRIPRGNKVCQFTSSGELISVYRSVTDAARETGVSRGGISHCIHGRTHSSGGFIWMQLSGSQTTIPLGSTREDELPVEAQRPPESPADDIVYAVSNNG